MELEQTLCDVMTNTVQYKRARGDRDRCDTRRQDLNTDAASTNMHWDANNLSLNPSKFTNLGS